MKAMMFLVSPAGRITRIVAGVALILLGYYLLHPVPVLAYVLIIVGVVPLLAGIFDWCVIARLLGLPFSGAKVRAMLAPKA